MTTQLVATDRSGNFLTTATGETTEMALENLSDRNGINLKRAQVEDAVEMLNLGGAPGAPGVVFLGEHRVYAWPRVPCRLVLIERLGGADQVNLHSYTSRTIRGAVEEVDYGLSDHKACAEALEAGQVYYEAQNDNMVEVHVLPDDEVIELYDLVRSKSLCKFDETPMPTS